MTAVLAVLLAATGCSSGNGGAVEGTAVAGDATPQRGGSLQVLEDAGFAGAWPTGLDPATNTNGSATSNQMQAIFGGLFLMRADDDGSNAAVVGNQAESGVLSEDGRTLTITLREGIEFSDGTPMDAAAVIWNFERASSATCTCAPRWDLRDDEPFTSPDPLTVEVHLDQPNAALLNGFPATNVNWIASPSAFEELGPDRFMIEPVGAGPFTVVSNQPSTELELVRNPNYFEEGRPYLDELTFTSIGGDQPALQALLAGQAHVYEGMTSPAIIEQAAANPQLQTVVQPGTSPYLVQMNTRIAPFDDQRAREAIYLATDWEAINEGLFGGEPTIVQGFTTPVDLFYEPTTPGYRTYDLEAAKELVSELGGLTVQLDTPAIQTATQITTALQTQWEEAGIDVELVTFPGSSLIQRLTSKEWQAVIGTAGAWDPAVGTGVAFRFESTSPYSGVEDPQLDDLLDQAVATTELDERDQLYQEIARYLSDNAYGTFGFAFAPTNVSVDGVHGPGLTTQIPSLSINTVVPWDEVWLEQDR
ncbi:ABC transporter substrate-binding protein [Modestobacter roseus]|uniref:ABC transporter substrate-binding protein n=1 Tax=Modestobacter roseus TaxID=1181884 RepID=UPI001E536856|nr:ABC transporter substrate-binding protein [Modestobacter roseus]